jgi:hypothetical protein
MRRVLLVASDECIRATCCELLRSLGFDADATDDIDESCSAEIVVLWEPNPDDVARARAAVREASAIVALTREHRRAWEGADVAVPLPFDSTRIAQVLVALGRAGARYHRATRPQPRLPRELALHADAGVAPAA